MAKSMSFFGLRSGSTKSHTYQVYRGQQITKDRVSHVSNPQSTGQMYQRLKLVAIAAAASRLNGLVNHSWEGVEYGYKSVAEFRRRALSSSAGRQMTSYVPKGLSDTGLMAWPLSAGTLLGVPYEMNPQTGGNLLFKPKIISSIPADIVTAPIKEQDDETYNYLMNLFNFSGDKRAQVSIVRQQVYSNNPVTYQTGKNTTAKFYRSFFSICRLILDKDNKEDSGDWTITLTTNDGETKATLTSKALNQSIVIEHTPETTTDQWTGTISFTNLTDIGAYPVVGGAIICSEQDDTIWRRSNSTLAISPAQSEYWSFYDEVIYGYLNDKSESDKYLNTGSESTNLVTA